MTAPVFYDVEASGLNAHSFPIEVGWSEMLANGQLVARSVLIRPPIAWQERIGAWDPAAQEIHGISLDQLRDEGLPPREVTTLLNEALFDRTLHSDSPEFDGRWMEELFYEAGAVMDFTLSTIGADTLVVAAASKMGDLDYTAAERLAHLRAPKTHRAADDSRYWAYLWKLVREGHKAGADARPAFGRTRDASLR